MTIEEQIAVFEHNAEHERKEGDLNNCLNFRQLAEWLKELQAHREAWENVITGINDTLETLSDGGDDWFTAEKLNDVLDIIAEYRPKEGDAE